MQNIKKYLAEFLGTAVLVLFGCGSAVLTGNLIVIAITFGLAIIIGAYGIASVSGCHINPAVSLAMLINGKMSFKDFCAYVAAQIAGAFAGSGLLYAILSCTNRGTDNLGANGYEALSTTGITMSGAILVEIILTFVFIYVILSVTAKAENAKIAGIIIALTLVAVHIIGINLTGTSVNPARSLAPAVLLGGEALNQVWVFLLAPLAGSAAAACTYKLLAMPGEDESKTKVHRIKAKK
jgi:aquaporin Z